MGEITIQDLLNIIRKRLIWIVLAAALCGAVVGVYFYGFVEDEYTAQSVLYVLQTYQDSSNQTRVDTGASTFFAADYKVLIQSVDIREKTAQQVGLGSVAALNQAVKIDINAQSGTRVLNVTVVGADPELCTQVANVVSRVFVESIQELTKSDALAVASEARVPTKPSGPPRSTYLLLSALVGALVCALIFILKEMLNTRVATDAQIEEELQQPVLANIYDYRKEINTFLTKPNQKSTNLFQIVSMQTQESVRMLSANIQFVERGNPIRALTFTSATPNEGKSSLSLMVGQVMAQEGRNVLLVDMDFRNPSIGKFLKMRHPKDLVDYMMGDEPLSAIIAPTSIRNLSMIDSNHRKISLSRVVRSAAFDVFLSHVREMFDVVIFDTPPLGMFIDAAVLGAKLDGAVLVIAEDHVELRQARTVIEQLNKSGIPLLGVALNYVRPQTVGSYYGRGRYGYYSYYSAYSAYGADSKKKRKRTSRNSSVSTAAISGKEPRG